MISDRTPIPDLPGTPTARIATDEGLLVVDFEYDPPRTTVQLPGRTVRSMLVLEEGVVLCGTDRGLMRHDPAEHDPDEWDAVGSPLGDARVTALAAGPGASGEGDIPGVIWAGTEPSAVYRSADGGKTWTACADPTELPSSDEWRYPPRPDTHHVRTLAPHPRDPDRLVVGIEAGAVIRTTDGGRSWSDRTPDGPRDPHVLLVHPDDPALILAAAGDGWAESADFGISWVHPDEGLEHGYVWDASIDADGPEATRTILLVAARNATDGHRAETPASYLYRRRHPAELAPDVERREGHFDTEEQTEPAGRSTWERVDTGPHLDHEDRRVSSVSSLPGAPGVFLLCTQSTDLFLTLDAGDTWVPLGSAWPEEHDRPEGVAAVRIDRV